MYQLMHKISCSSVLINFIDANLFSVLQLHTQQKICLYTYTLVISWIKDVSLCRPHGQTFTQIFLNLIEYIRRELQKQPTDETISVESTLLCHWSSWINYNSNGGGGAGAWAHVCLCVHVHVWKRKIIQCVDMHAHVLYCTFVCIETWEMSGRRCVREFILNSKKVNKSRGSERSEEKKIKMCKEVERK